eukprot:TRINITY_DN2645_c0_g2_i1.p1 TRINITY_DN2645_c0_g2~~TRINITY_DN2645_c0_g2_i1.p1  ORF type:complete len:839 (-),score=296.92 TRINITY_DN2645_c0_g2_i1:166-2682(-)
MMALMRAFHQFASIFLAMIKEQVGEGVPPSLNKNRGKVTLLSVESAHQRHHSIGFVPSNSLSRSLNNSSLLSQSFNNIPKRNATETQLSASSLLNGRDSLLSRSPLRRSRSSLGLSKEFNEQHGNERNLGWEFASPPLLKPLPLTDAFPRRKNAAVQSFVDREGNFEWKIPEEFRMEWTIVFQQLQNDDYIPTSQMVRILFKTSDLDEDQISAAVVLADLNGDARLDCEEFVLARFLVQALSQGQSIPTPLPKTLFSSQKLEEDLQTEFSFSLFPSKLNSPRLEYSKAPPQSPAISIQNSYEEMPQVYSARQTKPLRNLAPLALFQDEENEGKREENEVDTVFTTRSVTNVVITAVVNDHNSSKSEEKKADSIFRSSSTSVSELMNQFNKNGDHLGKQLVEYSPEGCEPSEAQVSFTRDHKGEKLVLSGTIDGLIQCLASEQNMALGLEYTEILMITHTHFTTSQNFLKRLVYQYFEVENGELSEEQKRSNQIFQFRIINFIRKWIEAMPKQFQNVEVQLELDNFVSQLKHSPQESKNKCGTILENSLILIEEEEEKEKEDKKAAEKKIKSMSSSRLQFMDISPRELAKQMTLFDHNLFSSIPSTELMHKGWEKGEGSNRFSARMEQVTYWTAKEIVEVSGLKNRTTVLTQVLKLAECLLELKNFYSLYAIYLALSLLAIERLKKTWKSLPSRYVAVWSKISELLAPVKNFLNYRRLWNASSLPKIPTPTIFQKDLLFIEDGNPDEDENGLINFEKLVMLGRTMNSIREAQKSTFPFAYNHKIHEFLIEGMIPLSSSDLLNKSKQCEPNQESPSLGRSLGNRARGLSVKARLSAILTE